MAPGKEKMMITRGNLDRRDNRDPQEQSHQFRVLCHGACVLLDSCYCIASSIAKKTHKKTSLSHLSAYSVSVSGSLSDATFGLL
ncbi:hypothetical protein RJT34_24391 [Clitoria ternatea]|uniref:Uncharacterized protein n=1 Tax=Clitoria ternatea TaxID=43366 RepID=A0AAN9FMT3_CLITE